ncbi:unnamed protein product [Clonostachys solani]|uniref:non-specific serine/threonine protein kinase n=1 Tax=Clonostachys solani TaxID=160281 RepID=A0A9P0EHN1_9HYPO|nr:unnamed protein product [Clonostachys solani]
MPVDHLTRTAAADEDGADQIGYETPRSGVATPQPDLQDKRLPGIMSYFGQVRPDTAPVPDMSSSVPCPHTDSRPSNKTLDEQPPSASSSALQPRLPIDSSLPCSGSQIDDPSSSQLHTEDSGLQRDAAQDGQRTSHPYPTPPTSLPSSAGSSLRTKTAGASCSKALVEPSTARPQSPSTCEPSPSARITTTPPPPSLPSSSSSCPPPPSSSTTAEVSETESRDVPSVASNSESSVAPPQATLDNQTSSSTNNTHHTANPNASQAPSKWFSLDGLMELTRGVFKSGPPTPTRALSAAQSHSDVKISSSRSSNDGAETSGTQTPRGPSGPNGAQAPIPKGKMTIKIPEGRGLRRCRDPYVVVVFQRSELISGGPHPNEEEENLVIPPPSMGGIAIQRQGSDSGRPPMSIPMRSRQSSNTSTADHSSIRNRLTVRTALTDPKWDAEAVFDVVDSDMLVDISVYDHTVSGGEEFLGHVDLEAPRENEKSVEGWFQLEGHADTMAENAPTGELYVEASYQRSEKRQFGPSDFEILKLIGKGTFGQVYQVRKRDTKRIYAMKVLQKKVIVQKKEVAHTVGERNILVRTAMSDSPFIVNLKFSFQTPSELYLVTDYMSGGELFWHLQKEGRFDEKRAKFYIAELILAIQHLHNNDIVYRDLKPENILLDANGHIALCDFGLSKANLTNNDTTNTFCGTTEYLAPEVLLDESGYTKMVDFWSLGVLVFEMCCGWSPFYAEDTQQMYKNIAFGKVRFPRDTLSQEGRNFVKGLLNRNPKHRLGATGDAEELKRHAFFGDIDWDLLTKKLITPPFKPKLKSETDVSYFDPEFTTALDQNGSLNERAAALARGYAASTPLSPSVQANFQGFTFVDESALDDHMRDRIRNDDEDMDDTRGTDDDWDNIDDLDPRRGNRMSGIIRTNTHDDQMVGGTHFDM